MTKFPNKAKDLKRKDVTEKAKLCKKELKEKFPNTKFRIRSKRYSGGSSFTASWKNGPAESLIKPIVDKYSYHYPDEDRQADYHHVDNYAFSSRKITQDVLENIADQIKPFWSESTFPNGRILDNPKFKEEVNAIIYYASFNSDLNIINLDQENMLGQPDYKIKDGKLKLNTIDDRA